MKIATSAILPASLDLKGLSFFSRWYGSFTNVYEVCVDPVRIFCFGYWFPNSDSEPNRAVCIIEEHEKFSLKTRSFLWSMAEITIERQNDWLIFSREQDDLSADQLSSFVTDSKSLLEHLRSEGKRLAPDDN